MSKNQIIIALVVLCLVGTIWGSVQDKKSTSLERQLEALKAQPVAETVVADDSAVKQIQAELEDIKAQNAALLEKAATLKGTISSQKDEIASLKAQPAKSGGSSVDTSALEAKLEENTAALAGLEEKLAAAKALAEKKDAELAAAKDLCAQKDAEVAAAREAQAVAEKAQAAAEKAQADLEEMKTNLANSVDAYNAKSQALSSKVEESAHRILSLENALEDRTKLLQAKDVELARTTLNMNVLLSKIAAQNNSLAILEETRVAMDKELAAKFLTIQELEAKLSEQVSPAGAPAVQHH